jgi:hypothetical protein
LLLLPLMTMRRRTLVIDSDGDGGDDDGNDDDGIDECKTYVELPTVTVKSRQHSLTRFLLLVII